MQGNLFQKDWTARAIAILSILLFGGYVLLVTLQPADDNDLNVVNLVWVISGHRVFCGEFLLWC